MLPANNGMRPGGPGSGELPNSGRVGQGIGAEGVNSVTNPNELPKDFSNLGNFNQDPKALEAHTVHFAYDSIAIRGNEQANVAAAAGFLKSAPPGVGLLIEGHCDERGTEEYNRALGDRRALALREALMALGADGQRITTISYGKDRKVDTGNTEAAHAKNRRGVFVVLTPK